MEEIAAQKNISSEISKNTSEIQVTPPGKKTHKWIWILGLTFVIVVAVGGFLLLFPKKELKVYHVGILSGLNYFSDVPKSFKEKMTELGYIEGKNIIYDLHQLDFNMDEYKKALQKFIDEKSDLALVYPTEAAELAKSMLSKTSIPMVFIGANVEDAHLIKSIREPGGNLTGVHWVGSDIAMLRYDTMREIVPDIKRYIIPYQKGISITQSQIATIRVVADRDKISIIEIPAENISDLKKQFNSVTIGKDDAIFCILDPLSPSAEGVKLLNSIVEKYKIPISGISPTASDGSNSLFFVNPINTEMGKQAAALAAKILRGYPAGKIPVTTAESQLILNYKAAQRMNINISEKVFSKANEIIR
jgi:putative tryptophan/tyrosine transport system substrate-binding protein